MDAINSLPALPLGASDIKTLRLSNMIYADKTALVHELASLRQKFFLTRPRRFGKSLLVSTFASLFSDGLKDFGGLAIEKLWQDTTYQVVKIDFSEAKNFIDLDDFARELDDTLESAFAPAGFVRDAAGSRSLMGSCQPGSELRLPIRWCC